MDLRGLMVERFHRVIMRGEVDNIWLVIDDLRCLELGLRGVERGRDGGWNQSS